MGTNYMRQLFTIKISSNILTAKLKALSDGALVAITPSIRQAIVESPGNWAA